MECAMAQAIQEKMSSVEGKESIAMEGLAKALQTIPCIMADNAGYDSADLLGGLRAAHARGQSSYGLNFNTATVSDMAELGIMESFRSKMSQLCAAAEAAEMIVLRMLG